VAGGLICDRLRAAGERWPWSATPRRTILATAGSAWCHRRGFSAGLRVGLRRLVCV